jgi:putative tricarboxylic transport membrane protein
MSYFLDGLAASVTPFSLLVIIIGVLWGMVIGALPGLGLVIAITLALPFTYSMNVSDALLLLVATAAGAQFGNGVTAITVGIPGSPSAVLTVVEGYTMFKRGEGGEALFLNLVAAFIGQVLGAVGFVLLIVPLAAVAPSFLAPEMFALTVIGLLAVATLTAGDLLKGISALVVGLIFGTVGADPVASVPRFVLGIQENYRGLDIVAVTVGLLGLGELLHQLYTGTFARSGATSAAAAAKALAKQAPQRLRVWAPLRSLPSVLVAAAFGCVLAFFIGVIPGLGATAATFIVYQQLRLVARKPELLGKGSREGLVAQNTADNAVVGGELVPTLGLGIPGSGSMAVLMGALVLQGIEPGPNVLQTRPELTGTVAAGLVIAGLFLLPLGWAFSYYAFQLTRVWPAAIFSGGISLILLGAFAAEGRVFDIYMIILFGVVGFLLRKFDFPVAATAIGFVLSGLLETNFRHGVLITEGSIGAFFSRPITLILLLFAAGMLVQQWFWNRRRARRRKDAQDTTDSPVTK